MANIARKFEGKVALITGAAGGIGSALVRRFVAEGAKVAAADLNASALRAQFQDTLPTDQVEYLQLDVTSENSVRAGVQAVASRWGQIDILVNNAGVYPFCAIEDLTLEEWRRVMAINLEGVFLMTQAVVPFMKRQKSGRIVSVSSSTVFKGTPGFCHYVASKMGVIGFSRALAGELGPWDITVNVVAPGLTTTDTALKSVPPALLEQRVQDRALKRPQVANDLVGPVVFLASQEGGFMTGQTLNVDGGVSFI
jgi:NAD(P)-dependent dehydrogenase (short-subunit alcohol dehydrogenase family)